MIWQLKGCRIIQGLKVITGLFLGPGYRFASDIITLSIYDSHAFYGSSVAGVSLGLSVPLALVSSLVPSLVAYVQEKRARSAYLAAGSPDPELLQQMRHQQRRIAMKCKLYSSAWLHVGLSCFHLSRWTFSWGALFLSDTAVYRASPSGLFCCLQFS